MTFKPEGTWNNREWGGERFSIPLAGKLKNLQHSRFKRLILLSSSNIFSIVVDRVQKEGGLIDWGGPLDRV